MKKNKKDEQAEKNEIPYTGRTYAYVAIALAAAAVVFLGLVFTVLGIYSLIASILLCLASLAFINTQKKKNNFKELKIIKITAYVLLGVIAALFIGGIIWSAVSA